MSKRLMIVISLVLFLVGLFVISNSVRWGSRAGNAYLASQGGMDTTQFMIIMQESINTYKWIGGILAMFGGLGFIRTVELK